MGLTVNAGGLNGWLTGFPMFAVDVFYAVDTWIGQATQRLADRKKKAAKEAKAKPPPQEPTDPVE